MLSAIGLHHPKSHHNIGAVLRASECYGAKLVAVSGKRYKRSLLDVNHAYTNIPLVQCDDLHEVLPFDCVPIAVEMLPRAISLFEYEHPKQAFYIFGPEDGTMGEKILSWCRDVVYIPTTGCMNLAGTVNVVLYDRLAKLQRAQTVGRGTCKQQS